MSQSLFQVKGWCPGAHKPMRSGEGFILRVKPTMGIVNLSQAKVLRRIALKYGSNVLETTCKANIQIRGVREQDLSEIKQLLQEHDLLDSSEVLESRRNIVLNPHLFFSANKAAVEMIYGRIVAALNEYDVSVRTPAKFSILIDDYFAPLLAFIKADVRLELCEVDGELHVYISFAGDANTAFAMGRQSISRAIETVIGTTLVFFDSGKEKKVFRQWIANDSVVSKMLFSGRAGERRFLLARNIKRAYDLLSKKHNYLMFSSRFGVYSLEQWQEIINCMELRGIKAIYISPHKVVMLPLAADLFTDISPKSEDISDRRELDIHACPGKPLCNSANGYTRSLYDFLLSECGDLFDGSVRVHVSGCAKGCAFAGESELTLLVEPNGYRFGMLCGTRLINDVVVTKDQLGKILNNLRIQYQRHSSKYADAAAFLAEFQSRKNV